MSFYEMIKSILCDTNMHRIARRKSWTEGYRLCPNLINGRKSILSLTIENKIHALTNEDISAIDWEILEADQDSLVSRES